MALAKIDWQAAANHLVRELAVEMSPLVRVNAVAPATVVQGSAMFPRDRVVSTAATSESTLDASQRNLRTSDDYAWSLTDGTYASMRTAARFTSLNAAVRGSCRRLSRKVARR